MYPPSHIRIAENITGFLHFPFRFSTFFLFSVLYLSENKNTFMEEKKLRKVYLMVEFGKPFAVKRRCM
mgnify:CR=1 FL=1